MNEPPEAGQALIEFSFVALILVGALGLGAGLLRVEWNRFQCTRSAFEAAHSRLMAGHLPRRSVLVQDLPDRVEAKADCGGAVEKVALYRLEREDH